MASVNPFVDEFIARGVLKTKNIIEAFRKVDRADFIPDGIKEEAYVNAPLSIGRGQTISQPETVAFMLELLEPGKGEKIWDIGFGSGWQTALLARIIGPRGRVFAQEIIPEIFERGRENVAVLGYKNVEFILGDATKGFDKEILFDRIIAAASAQTVPLIWLDSLKINGRLVLPIKESVWLYIKKDENEFYKKEYKGFLFVPLVSD